MRLGSCLFACCISLVLGCNTGPKEVAPEPPTEAPKPTTTIVTKLGSGVDEKAQKVALADVAKNPDAFVGKTFATTGTVTAVCQHMGCWMEIKDDAGEAHIRMAGHSFFVPKTASGHKARVMATLVKGNEPEPMCAEDGTKKGCRAEAEQQLGRPLAKLELVAQGVEIL